MNNIIKVMLDKYRTINLEQQKNALREVLQNVILYCLSKTDFFNYAAFYGGTCLRICHNLNRFSEDLDFTLIKDNKNFKFIEYGKKIVSLLLSFGINAKLISKTKKVKTDIITSYLDFDLKELIKTFYPPKIRKKINVTNSQKLSIKFEIDANPISGAILENMFLTNPYGFAISKFDLSSLFAAKIDCVLDRNWKIRGMKGRDLFDYVFYLSNGAKFNLNYLKNKWIQRKRINAKSQITLQKVKDELINKFKTIDFKQVINDVSAFVYDKHSIEVWSKEFFIDITNRYLKD